MNKKLYLLFIVLAQISYPMERSKSYDNLFKLNEEESPRAVVLGSSKEVAPRAVVLDYCRNIHKSIKPETQIDRRRRTYLNQEQVTHLREALLSVCTGLIRNKSFESQVKTVPFKDSNSSK